MTHQALARKWRPRSFSEVVAQQHVLTGLINSLNQQQLHHAYLFTGTRGVGKTTIARLFAKSLNCEQGVSATPCGKCSNCLELDQGNFVDLLEIDAASRTKVEDTRELLDNVQYSPARGRYKVYLIDEVHMLSRHSFNALLKTLEEPPEHVKFLLATTDPQKLPVTVLSRCLQFQLKALSESQIAEQLQNVLSQEGRSFEDSALKALAHAADGSMRDALSLTDQALALGRQELQYQSVLAMLGVLDPHHIKQLLCHVVANQSEEAFVKVDELCQLAPDFAHLHQQLAECLHQVALAQVLPASQHDETILMLAEQLPAELVQLLYQIATTGKRDLSFAPSPRTGFEMTVLRMLAFKPASSEIKVEAAPALNADDLEQHSLDKEQAEIIEQAQQQGFNLAEKTPSPEQAKPTEPVKGAVFEQREHTLENIKRQISQASGDVKPAPVKSSAIVAEATVTAELPSEKSQPTEVATTKPSSSGVALETPAGQVQPAANPELDYYSQLSAQAESMEAEYDGEQVYGEPGLDLEPSRNPETAPAQVAAQTTIEAAPKVENASLSTESLLQLHSQLRRGDKGKKPEAAQPQASAKPVATQQVNNAATTLDAFANPANKPSYELETSEAGAAVAEHNQAKHSQEQASRVVAEQPQQPSIDPALAHDTWSVLLANMPLGPIARQIALNALFEQQGESVKLLLKPDFAHLPKPTSVAELEQGLSAQLGQKVSLEIVVGEDSRRQTPLELQQALHVHNLEQAKQRLLADDNIKFIQANLGGELLEESVNYH